MNEKIKVCGIVKEPGYAYFVDQDGDVARTRFGKPPLSDAEKSKRKKEKIARAEKVKRDAEARIAKLKSE